MNTQMPEDAGVPSGYVQAVIIYSSADREVAEYFRNCRREIDEFTGPHIIILFDPEIEAGDSKGISDVVDAGKRYPGLRFVDLPCLWIEDDHGGRSIARLPHEVGLIRQFFRSLADVVRKTKDAPEIARRVSTELTEDTAGRSPLLDIIKKGLPVTKADEKRTAVIFGVIFVTAILVIAIFIPNPSAFAYTVFRIVLALAAAGFVSMTPGFIKAQVGNTVRAGGALAAFVIVYFFAPAALPA